MIFHKTFDVKIVLVVLVVRSIASFFIYKDYSLLWSKATEKTFLIKSLVYISAFVVYMSLFYTNVTVQFLLSELFLFLFSINFLVYFYYYIRNDNKIKKVKTAIIYGAGKAGEKLESEFSDSEYLIKYFVDDNKSLHHRSIDGKSILSQETLKDKIGDEKFDLLLIAMPTAKKERVKEIYESLNEYFLEIKILPSMNEILREKDFSSQLKDISVEDLLARHPQDLDTSAISEFIEGKKIMITGAGGSIGSELVRQCLSFNASELILVDHGEYNLYKIIDEQEKSSKKLIPILQSVVNKELLAETFKKHKPQIVIHAAAYKHVPLVEENVQEAILNNIIGTKNCIDLSIENGVENFLLISTDKAVRPTNVMGTTKRICELYAQNIHAYNTEIVAVRFGNVLGSSGSVIPKFKNLIENNKNLTVTHPEITRYFMLIPEACELVLQAASLGKGGEIFILDMGEPIKIIDLAKRMIKLSGKSNIEIEFTGLRAGEKLYEELLLNESDISTEYQSITVAKKTIYDIDTLQTDIKTLVHSTDQLKILKKIVPEFDHRR